MPMHDWTRVDAGLFHAFHHDWITALAARLNNGVLPSDYFALPEQRIGGPIPDVLTLKLAPGSEPPGENAGGLAVAVAPPRTRFVRRKESQIYADKAKRITVRHRHGDVVAVIEIVSTGNKSSRAEVRTFMQNSAELIHQGVHLLVIDPFPPGKHDPQRLVQAIWDEFSDEGLQLAADKPLSVASFDASLDGGANTEAFAVGMPLPEMPLFLRPEVYVPVPLEETYQTTWATFPRAVKGLLEPGS